MMVNRGLAAACALFTLFLVVHAPAQAQDAVFRSGMEIPTCAEVEYNAGLVGQPFPATWQDIFNASFPNPIGVQRRVIVQTGRVASLAFTATQSTPSGRIETAESAGDPGGIHTISISTCRADFRAYALNNVEGQCMSSAITSQQALIFVPGQFTGSSFCRLVPGQTYWLNIAFTGAGAGNPENTCEAAQCAALMTARVKVEQP